MEEKKHISFDELVSMLPTPGWDLTTGQENSAENMPVKNQKLEDLVKAAHSQHIQGETPGLIQKIENEILLDLPDMQKLWIHLGLPF